MAEKKPGKKAKAEKKPAPVVVDETPLCPVCKTAPVNDGEACATCSMKVLREYGWVKDDPLTGEPYMVERRDVVPPPVEEAPPVAEGPTLPAPTPPAPRWHDTDSASTLGDLQVTLIRPEAWSARTRHREIGVFTSREKAKGALLKGA